MGKVEKLLKDAVHQDFHKLDVLGRNLIGVAFVMLGIVHIFSPSLLVGYIPLFFFLFKVLLVMLSGILFLAAGVCFILERYMYEAALYLAIFLAFISLTVSLPMFNVVGFFTNVAIIGALLMLADKYDHSDRTITNVIRCIIGKSN